MHLLSAALFCVALLVGCQNTPPKSQPAPFARAGAPDTLTLVGDGTISRKGENVYGTAYTPGGDTLFFHTTDRGDGASGVAMTVRIDTGWAAPRPAPFDTEWYDEGRPSITPDGAHIVFSSDRTAGGTGPPQDADEFY